MALSKDGGRECDRCGKKLTSNKYKWDLCEQCNEIVTRQNEEAEAKRAIKSLWIPLKYRDAREEEKKLYDIEYGDVDFVLDCALPDNAQEVLVTLSNGEVTLTTFYNDYGCYFENYEDKDDVKAWMPLPDPYKEA